MKQAQPMLDEIAEGCMQCHNGVQASHIVVKTADASMQFSSSGQQVNHPVGMNYDDYATRRSRAYMPRFSLDSNILLVNGQVSCVSCHRLKETDEAGVLIETHMNENRQDTFDVPGNEMQLGHINKENCTASGNLTVGPRETDLCLACHAI
jgi:hypothetical protein